MKIQFKALVSMAALAVASFAAPAYALVDDFVFGSTGSGGSQQLILNGGAYVIDAGTKGWVREDGFNNGGAGNYIVGDCANCGGHNYHDYFTFDLSNVTGTITSAVISLWNPIGGFTGNAKTLVLHGLNEDSVSGLTTGGVSLYNNIALSDVIGTAFLDATSNGTQVLVNLNAFAVAGLNRLEGTVVAAGGTIGVSSVPLPAGLPMFGTALLGLFGYRANRKLAA